MQIHIYIGLTNSVEKLEILSGLTEIFEDFSITTFLKEKESLDRGNLFQTLIDRQTPYGLCTWWRYASLLIKLYFIEN